MRNVLEHSEAQNGAFVCAQYNKEKNRIWIGIADIGIGIKASLGKHHFSDSNLEAIRLALWPGITGTTKRIGGNDQNAGVGLFFTKSIAKVNRDYFMIYSGDAMYKLHMAPKRKKIRFYPDAFKEKHKRMQNLPFWRGTVVGINITLNQTQEFDSLIRILLDILPQAISERNREKYKLPKFI